MRAVGRGYAPDARVGEASRRTSSPQPRHPKRRGRSPDLHVRGGEVPVDDIPERLEVLRPRVAVVDVRSEEHTSELQSLMRISYAVFCLKKKKQTRTALYTPQTKTTT